MDITISEMAAKLHDYDAYRIVYHIRPDGDCIGSAFALALALREMGKQCDVVGQDPIPSIHHYMTDLVPMDAVENPTYIAIDSASPHRVGVYGDQHFTFCIDHHNNTFTEATYRYVETDCGACSEIVYKLILEMGVPITKEIANFLYTALVTDTICFRTTDTSVQSFETAVALAKAGADIYRIGRLHTFIKSKGRMKIESILRDSFHYTCDNQVVTGIILLKDLETAGVQDADLEGINSLVEQTEGVRVGATIRELPDGRMRCSMRSNGPYSVNEICKLFGGGGHFNAACCELSMSAEEARETIERTCRDFFDFCRKKD
jgi:phosphoesterase RecJ-like protein